MRAIVGALAILGALAAPAMAQEWPAKQVNFIVPFSAGGTTDLFGRLLAQHMQKNFDKPFIVENKAGAGGNIGAGRSRTPRPTATPSSSARCRRTRSTRSSIPSCPMTP